MDPRLPLTAADQTVNPHILVRAWDDKGRDDSSIKKAPVHSRSIVACAEG